MSIIGRFNYDAENNTYAGDLLTLTLQRGNMRLVPNKKSRDEEPDYRVVASTPLGDVEFGAAWKRTGEHSGRDFLSVRFDDPAMPESLYASLFMDDDGKNARLIWSRKKPEQKNASEPVPAEAKKAAKPKKAA